VGVVFLFFVAVAFLPFAPDFVLLFLSVVLLIISSIFPLAPSSSTDDEGQSKRSSFFPG